MKARASSKAASTRSRVAAAGSVKPISGEWDIVTKADGMRTLPRVAATGMLAFQLT